MQQAIKIVVEHHQDGYLAYPLGLKGVIVGQGDTHEDTMRDVESAIQFHRESFGEDALQLDQESPILDAFVAEAAVEIR
ncbi:MAG: type II toxin-antitoxin system HicB family antitoxin [Candidatus Hydrogenedentes bacterium]|nr:type II toxin-antitoxin system HicB family antitoxin [Candidatus Hydrogenedentota bacterium]